MLKTELSFLSVSVCVQGYSSLLWRIITLPMQRQAAISPLTEQIHTCHLGTAIL